MANNLTSNSLGSFESTTGVFVVSDPCYDLGTWCAGELKNVKNGTWNAIVRKSDEGDWGIRCAEIIAYHESVGETDLEKLDWKLTDIYVGVDSGQAGFFDKDLFKNGDIITKDPKFGLGGTDSGDRWYSACCDITLSEESAGVLPGGVVSSSGYGDGGYECFIVQLGEEVVAAKIVFIGEEEIDDEIDGE